MGPNKTAPIEIPEKVDEASSHAPSVYKGQGLGNTAGTSRGLSASKSRTRPEGERRANSTSPVVAPELSARTPKCLNAGAPHPFRTFERGRT